jgi:hypothetical protein
MSHKEKRPPDHAKALAIMLVLIMTGCQPGTAGPTRVEGLETQQPTATDNSVFFSPIGSTA